MGGLCPGGFRSRGGGGSSRGRGDQPKVELDITHMGSDCVIVKNGRRICGVGGALATAPLMQSRGYWEIKVQTGGSWGVGVATRAVNLESMPLGNDAQSWVLRSDGFVYHRGNQGAHASAIFEDGDTLSCSYDHVVLRFYLNGELLPCEFASIKGAVYPCVYVDDGAIIDMEFENFDNPPPHGYSAIMFEKELL